MASEILPTRPTRPIDPLDLSDEIMKSIHAIEAVSGLMEKAFERLDAGYPEVYGGALLIGTEARKIRELLGEA